ARRHRSPGTTSRSRGRPAPPLTRSRGRRPRRRPLLERSYDPRVREALIVDAVRTPIGRYAGSLSTVRPDDLAARAIEAAVERNGLPVDEVDDVVFGCVNGAG